MYEIELIDNLLETVNLLQVNVDLGSHGKLHVDSRQLQEKRRTYIYSVIQHCNCVYKKNLIFIYSKALPVLAVFPESHRSK